MLVGPRRFAAIVAALAALLALSGCASDELDTDTTATTTATKPVVAAIGDSIMKGHGLTPAQAWPELLARSNHWALDNLSCDGAGFVKTGDADDCGGDFSGLVAEAVTAKPSLIIISGSSNDLGISNAQLEEQTIQVVKALRAALPTTTIVGISTVWNDTVAPDQMDDINEQVRQAVKGVGGVYLDIGQPLAGHRSWLQSDDVHPTARGQRELAKAIAGAVRSAKLKI
ncbi:MAG TPA: SGNH/GDSL hydrolase family protein [Microbacteriaceae bacterium]|jgi:acyl-CoA thioesterase-1|nr:SGNH/GDSL hydrolase family protein [Microbacteriaceae bacterium]